ncbi:MAG: sigma-54 dependent transcriptional regulator, partial [Thiotrichaceae bacterium]
MSEQSVLIIDDEPDIRELLEITLLRMGLTTYSASNVKEALASLQNNKPDLCLTDMKLPDGTGIDIVNYIHHNMPNIPVAVITAYGSMETAVEALKSGAYDFVSKPVDLQKLRELIETALKLSKNKSSSSKQATSSTALPSAHDADENTNKLILGNSPAIQQLLLTIRKLGKSHAPVYINGESGSGKELVAKSIHNGGPHQDAPFIPVNCGAIPKDLVESEFFGHIKGSFSGAIADKKGLFEAASDGTLFLDEVADLPLEMQVKLLRAIQEQAIKPVGGTEEIPVNVRILSATHKKLELEVAAKRFREDLYYRLNVIKLQVPALRERGEDILLLAEYFLKDISKSWGLERAELTNEARDALLSYTFPGNVRELVNILERSCTLSDDGLITIDDLQLPALDTSTDSATVSITAHPTTSPTSNLPNW